MRKHSVRKWLHALLDLLPLVVIPVFMVYSHRHQIDSYSVQRTEYNTIHMQQNVINGLPNNTDNNISLDNATKLDGGDFRITDEWTINFNMNDILINEGDKVLGKAFIEATSNDIEISYDFTIYLVEEIIIPHDDNLEVSFISTNESGYSYTLNEVLFYGYLGEDTEYIYIGNVQFFNLTQMFGSGNEPTIDEFNTLFQNDYYAVDSNAVAYVPYTRTYNDTDIGSQIFYSLYNSVDKYFNCNKLFSFNGVYNWINFNLFGGNAPLMVDVVYQIIVYEFFMDLIFLIYSVFMFIIDFASNFLEYCFSWSHRGGR